MSEKKLRQGVLMFKSQAGDTNKDDMANRAMNLGYIIEKSFSSDDLYELVYYAAVNAMDAVITASVTEFNSASDLLSALDLLNQYGIELLIYDIPSDSVVGIGQIKLLNTLASMS